MASYNPFHIYFIDHCTISSTLINFLRYIPHTILPTTFILRVLHAHQLFTEPTAADALAWWDVCTANCKVQAHSHCPLARNETQRCMTDTPFRRKIIMAEAHDRI